jgi:hypothetical protein
MKRYQFPTPRLAFGIAAVALTALTLTVSLVVPANLEVAPDARSVVATSVATSVATPAATPAAIEPDRTEMVVTTSRIEVVATRRPTTAAAPAVVTTSGRRHQV